MFLKNNLHRLLYEVFGQYSPCFFFCCHGLTFLGWVGGYEKKRQIDVFRGKLSMDASPNMIYFLLVLVLKYLACS